MKFYDVEFNPRDRECEEWFAAEEYAVGAENAAEAIALVKDVWRERILGNPRFWEECAINDLDIDDAIGIELTIKVMFRARERIETIYGIEHGEIEYEE